MPLSIVLSPIIREDDGLAMSSRNRYLTPDERSSALILSKALASVRVAFSNGERDTTVLESVGHRILAAEPQVQPDYLAVVDPATFKRTGQATPSHAAIVAARVGKTRLIDNMTLGGDDQD
jgi:pantoate--beta-alanine ligase